MVKVLFVCLGNICRSPMAEGVFQKMVDDAGLSNKISVDSAGTGSYHIGEPAHHGTRQVLQQNGIQYEGRARQFRRTDFDQFDYILAMDADNFANIESKLSKNTSATVRLFMEYAPQMQVHEVPDPYYTGGFDHVYELVTAASAGLLDAIRQEHNL
jgi:protein-tyrosine phosphatase